MAHDDQNDDNDDDSTYRKLIGVEDEVKEVNGDLESLTAKQEMETVGAVKQGKSQLIKETADKKEKTEQLSDGNPIINGPK